MPKHSPSQFKKIIQILNEYEFKCKKTKQGFYISKDNGPLILIHSGTKCKHDIRRNIQKKY